MNARSPGSITTQSVPGGRDSLSSIVIWQNRLVLGAATVVFLSVAFKAILPLQNLLPQIVKMIAE